LIRKHAAEAEIVTPDEPMNGDREGQLVWLGIRRAIAELQAIPVGKPN
jgi:hypothetical protein